ncbi:hypothetical protein KIPB_011063 [Kipferlia bialata]|uniref:C3H1-type domain-containing protein n=1 Tax=Kipferlia bialata TaxID=797122 RepID=A0A391P6D1_9EUKA|nr:hypothetical protein KIPB_011063 [Kipferlia bialata]|eukprot:g11063.t1
MKSQLCRNYNQTGFCPRGEKCTFGHFIAHPTKAPPDWLSITIAERENLFWKKRREGSLHPYCNRQQDHSDEYDEYGEYDEWDGADPSERVGYCDSEWTLPPVRQERVQTPGEWWDSVTLHDSDRVSVRWDTEVGGYVPVDSTPTSDEGGSDQGDDIDEE